WQALYEAAGCGDLRLDRYLDAALAALGGEPDGSLAALALRRLRTALDEWSAPLARPERLERLADHCHRHLSDPLAPYLENFIDVATGSEQVALLHEWLDDGAVPGGRTLDISLRWRILVRLAALDRIDVQRIDQERDGSSYAERHAALARTSRPDPQ